MTPNTLADTPKATPSSPGAKSPLPVDRKIAQRMSAAVALVSLVSLIISVFFLPGFNVNAMSFLFIASLGLIFFLFYLALPQLFFHETFLMLGDLVYVAVITVIATQAGEYGVLILFLYFVVIVADALKYPPSEYIIVVLVTIQSAFFYIILWSPFPDDAKIGILTLFLFSTISVAVFVWYFVNQVVYERSIRYVLERRSNYLQSMNDHLKAVDTMRENMMRITSHEFKTPIAAVKNALVLLQSHDFGKLSEDQLKLMQLAVSSNERLNHLVSDLLNTSRLAVDSWKISKSKIDLVTLVQDILREYQPKDITVTAHLPQTSVSCMADIGLLRIAFKNLVDNAIKYTAAGGSVTVTLTAGEKEIRYEVTDTGIGIPSDLIPHLFTQFNRSEKAIAMTPDGYGLGLYYTKIIIERHGGHIEVTSQEGHGSTFTITLPPPTMEHKEA